MEDPNASPDPLSLLTTLKASLKPRERTGKWIVADHGEQHPLAVGVLSPPGPGEPAPLFDPFIGVTREDRPLADFIAATLNLLGV